MLALPCPGEKSGRFLCLYVCVCVCVRVRVYDGMEGRVGVREIGCA